MKFITDRVVTMVAGMLPRVSADAACGPEVYYQYRCLTTGPCKVYQRRRCTCCPNCCGAWQSIGCCGGTCC